MLMKQKKSDKNQIRKHKFQAKIQHAFT